MSRDLTKGNINKNLIKLAFPIMATSFLQMAYNITDIYWVGKLGEQSVAAVGTAGYYLWLSFAFVLFIKVGAEVMIAQSLGAKDYNRTNKYSQNSLLMSLYISIIYMVLILIFKNSLIDYFKIDNKIVVNMSKSYLFIVSFSFPFNFFIQVISSIYNASGDSKLPFKINSIGLVANMILDPVLIFFFKLGAEGAAIATVSSQIIVAFIFILIVKKHPPYKQYTFTYSLNTDSILEMIKISYPPALQSALFTLIAMVIAKLVALFGTNGIAVARLGSQIESISFMTAGGFGVALSAMVGQNYGAKDYTRVRKSIKNGLKIMSVFGVFTSFVLIFFAKELFSIFIDKEPILSMGKTYLHILGLSQVFMCIEITLGGAFNGMGKSKYPALVSVILNAARIPAAYYLLSYTSLGISSIWWAISASSMFKGAFLVLLFIIVLNRFIDKNEKVSMT